MNTSGNAPHNTTSHDAQNSNSNALALPNMSRRSFFKLGATVGALTFLGSVLTPRGMLVSAYADEEGNSHFTVYVLARDEVPVLATDVADGKNVPLAGVEVTITSLYNGETLTLITDETGFVGARMQALSFECDDDTASTYTCYADVHASKEGYRLFHNPTVFLQSAVQPDEDGTMINAVEIATQPLEKGVPYLRTLALDEVDIQYSPGTAYVGSFNDENHTLQVEVGTTEPSTSVCVQVFINDKELCSTNVTSSAQEPYLANAQFEGTWLQDIEPGAKMTVKFAPQGGKTYAFEPPLTFGENLSVFAEGGDQLKIFPGLDSGDDAGSATIPKWLIDVNDKASLIFPYLGPIQAFSDTSGNFGISATLLQVTFLKRRDGKNVMDIQQKYDEDGHAMYDEDGDPITEHKRADFKTYSGMMGKKAWKNWQDETVKALSDYKTLKGKAAVNQNTFGCSKVSSKIDGQFSLSLMAYGNVKDPTPGTDELREWLFDLALQAELGVGISFSQAFTAGPVPLFWCFDLSALLRVRLMLGGTVNDGFTNLRWSHQSPGSPLGASVMFYIEAGLTLGAGIQGVASVGIRGYGWLQFLFMFTDCGDSAYPHITGKLSAGVQLTVQVLLFSKTWTLVTLDPWKFADNWSDEDYDNLSAAESGALRLDKVNFTMDDLITDEHMAETSEFELVQSQPTEEEQQEAQELLEALLEADLLSEENSALGSVDTWMTYARKQNKGLADNLTDDQPSFINPYAFGGSGGYNPVFGFKPTFEKLLYEGDCYSNARLRVFAGNKSLAYSGDNIIVYMARIATVDVEGPDGSCVARPRVVVRRWNIGSKTWSKEQVVDFEVPADDETGASAVPGYDRYDVDFDIDIFQSETLGIRATTLCVGVTSLTKPTEANEQSYEGYQNRQFVSVVYWIEKISPVAPTVRFSRSFNYRLAEGFCAYHPRVISQDNMHSLYFFERNIETGDTLIRVAPFVGYKASEKICIHEASSPVHVGTSNEAFANGTFNVTSPDRSYIPDSSTTYAHTVLTWSGRDKNDNALSNATSMFVGPMNIVFKKSLDLPGVSSMTRRTVQDSKQLYVFTRDKIEAAEKNIELLMSTDDYKLERQSTVGSTTNLQFFTSQDGKWLYTVRIMEETIPAADEETLALYEAGGKVYSSVHACSDGLNELDGASLTEDTQVNRYQILESRWISSLGAYHELYPIAQLSFCPDSIDVVDTTNGRRDFVMTTMVDPDTNKAQIYHVAVPDILGIQLEDVTPVCPYANAGQETWVLITVSNTGNALITGLTMNVFDADGTQVDTVKVTDLRTCVQQSMDNYKQVVDEETGEVKRGESGQPLCEFVEDIRDTTGVLWPGKQRTYRVGFMVPDTYQGETEFSVSVSNPVSRPEFTASQMAEMNALAGLAEDAMGPLDWLEEDDFMDTSASSSNLLFCEDPRTRSFTLSEQSASAQSLSYGLVPADYTTEGTDPTPSPSPSPTSNNSNGTDSPSTGDRAPIAALAGVAAVATGVAVASGVAAKKADESADF